MDESDEDAYIQDFIDNLEAQQAGDSEIQVSTLLPQQNNLYACGMQKLNVCADAWLLVGMLGRLCTCKQLVRHAAWVVRRTS